MSTKALYIRHKALPGKRDDVKRIWEKYARAYIDNAAGHVVYIYSFDDSDPDVIVAYQLHNGGDAAEDFASQPWYQDYERETAELLAEPSEFRTLTPQWIKGAAA